MTHPATVTDPPPILDAVTGPTPAPSTPAPPRSTPATAPPPRPRAAGGATPPGAPAAPGVRAGRLRNGELRAGVAAFLVAHAGAEFTPGEIARGLGRSSGAVGNALLLLTGRGEAEQTGTAPLRYRATAATAAATPSAAGAGAGPGMATRPRATRARKPRAATASPSSPATTATTTAATGATTGAATGPASGPGSPPAAVPSPSPAATGATGVEAAVVTGPVTRPNGQLYHPRQLSGIPDVTALRRLRAAGVPALLYGPPGTGKTSVVEAAFPDQITVQGDGDTAVADLVGEYTQTPQGRYVFVHGPLVRAMREGRCLFVDDATLIPPSVLAVVYPAMDGRRQIVVKANGGEVIAATAGFYVVAGHNPGVHGAILTDALSSRFSAQIQVSTDYDLAAQLKIDRRAVRVARNLATRARKGEIGWAPQLRELIAFARISDVLGPQAAAGNLVGIAPEEDRDTVAAVVRDAFGAAVAPLALGGRI